MSRRPRLEIPGVPMHVTQRGVNRCAIFLDDHDRQEFLQSLLAACRRHEVAIHAYVLMDNHVHLLLSAKAIGAVAQAMRLSGVTYVLGFNKRHERVGTLWQGRYKSCLVDTDAHLLRVIRYIELNPVRAALVEWPETYPWSSARAHLGLRIDPLLRFHPVYESLSPAAVERASHYRTWLHEPIDEQERAGIRRHLAQERALGEPRFQQMVERTLNQPATVLERGGRRGSRKSA